MSLSIALPFRAILWPVIGAATILILGRLLPNWLRRLAAAAFGILSLVSLSGLRSVEPARIAIPWDPINLFRTSPSFYPDALSVAAGIALAGVTVALVLGIRGRHQRTSWHALMLAALAGSLMTLLAANLLTLALGSALLDLAVIAIVLWVRTGEDQRRPTLAVAVPGVLSTFLFLFTALWLDTSVGHASLWARNLPGQTLQLVGIAGVLRMLVFPLHPQQLSAPEHAAAVLLPVGTGIYLLARVQGLEPLLAGTAGFMALGMIVVLVGGLLVWSGGLTSGAGQEDSSDMGRLCSAGLVYQTGYAVILALLFPRAALWPVLCLPVALAALVIWWDAGLPRGESAGDGWVRRVWQSTAPQRARLHAWGIERLSNSDRWSGLAAMRHLIALLPAIALASIAGVPMTAGFRQRWPLYAALLEEGNPSLLLVFVADVFVVAGFWLALGPTLRGADRRRSAPASLLAVSLLVALLIVAGVSADGFGLKPVSRADVSVWGLGLLFVLPWLVGTWLARWRSHLANYAQPIQSIVNLGWFYRTASWAGQRLTGLVYWLGQVGEGEGWWGWALIVLALGAVFLTAR